MIRTLTIGLTTLALVIPQACVATAQDTPLLLTDPSLSVTRSLLEQYQTNRRALDRSYTTPQSASKYQRLQDFTSSWLTQLEHVPFDELHQDQKIDYLLLRNQLIHEQKSLELKQQREQEYSEFVPFRDIIVQFSEAKRAMQPVDPRMAAEQLVEVAAQIDVLAARIEADELSTSQVVANRAAGGIDALRRSLSDWHGFHDGYDPLFTWWTADPYKKANEKLTELSRQVRKKYVGTDENALIGDPIGREALLVELQYEMIPYSPEELIEIANREFDWCRREMDRAATDLGFEGNWSKAMEHVKSLHEEPGHQPQMIKELALEATAYVNEHDLVTVPPLCEELWRMSMLSPERQLISPFFLGGEVIQVAFPTDTMEHSAKMMSMRGNNRHFARATVHHELIPGHHLQGYMAARFRAHRRQFATPFLIEGWALHWEMLLWDRGFQRSAEDRVGMLFWRAHRCARIIFSLNFHLNQMTADECVDLLVNEVGHERANAEAEVRRSIQGSYGPLYQAAYMLGGLQMKSLHGQLVEPAGMTEREFHDAVLLENSIPLEMIRASLLNTELIRDFTPSWRFSDP
jgi:uncharacterized protein (DUF885 family)